ncbi:ABC transporter permease [Mucilaginibacter gilvus]|uniref:FtsX-like permease family protein n=1 Tax=Mucilaginibacter gilvus TaxID=2305909 RepID=A0A444MME2_9SPHI|nr:ABC transporter permease [Mucilaginibacter gilvus]RWY50869.1 FtsX-like permease family protein [Mucilaginibacter gilvus]
MNKLDLKIAFRTFLKGKWYNFLNIAGLAMGLAAFIFVTLYVDNETSYDTWNKNINRVYLVEREMPTGPSPYTPGKLAAAIKSQCPEVEETGRMNTALFQLPFYTPSGRFLIKKWVGADYSISKILGVKPKGFNLDPKSTLPTVLLSKQTANVLFPGDSAIQNKRVNMASRTGMPFTVAGVADDMPGNTNLNFDCIGFSQDITQGKDQSYANQIYQTYLLVKPNADIALLSKKIDKIYKQAALADTSQVAKQALSQSPAATIYLDPLSNLHLKPHYGSQVNNQIVKGLIILAIIILIVTGVNFTNLYISQASKRSKEVGLKKVNGVIKRQIILQFLTEIFFQCLLALIIAFGLVVIGLPYFNNLLNVNLLISGINLTIITQLTVTLISLTLLAGIYPSFVMAGFKPIQVLSGNQFVSGQTFSWIRGAITVLQFTFAIGFVITLAVINQQVTFMRSENPGFTAKQVVYIDNLGIYNDPKKFQSARERIKDIPGVKNVTVASNVPGGIIPATFEYNVQNKAYAMQTIGVDYHYFETLNIGLKEGQAFSSSFPVDSANAVINETAAKAMGLDNAVGTTITGCGGNYKVIGVVKDVKANGFEANIQPAIYLMNAGCGLTKTQIMISAESNAIPAMLTTLGHQWTSINKLDGDNFNYHFLDELYGRLFIKQEQLKSVLFYFSAIAIFIASLGFFASAAQAIRLRMKEIAIRKVFGATGEQLMVTLSKPFFYIVLTANAIAWPLSFFVANKWLETFAYRIHISVTPFVTAMVISIAIVAVTVCLQIVRAVRFNPAVKLKV